jgi:hypothetical protein
MFGYNRQGEASYDKTLVDNAFQGKKCKGNISKSNA